MKHYSTLKVFAKLAYYFVKGLGFFPIHYDCHTKQFQTSRPQLVYSLLLLIAFSYTYLTSGVSIISALSPLIAVAFTNLSVTTISITLLLQCKNHQSIVLFSNRSKDLMLQINRTLLNNKQPINIRSQLVRLAFKLVFINFMAQFAVIKALHNLLIMITGSKDLMAIFIVSMAYFMQTMVPNIFFVALQVANFYLDLINQEVLNVVRRASFMQDNCKFSKFARIEEHCSCSDRIDELAELHQTMTHLLKDLNKLCALQLMFNVLNFFGILIIEVYLYYVINCIV